MKPTCHPEKKMWAKQLCKSCYERQRIAGNPVSKQKRKEYARDYQQKHAQQVKQYRLKYQRSDKYKQWKRQHHLKRYYNLSVEEFNVMFSKQKGLCYICENRLTRPHVDHCHATDKVRGLLCARCNTGLYILEDATLRQRAYDYLSS